MIIWLASYPRSGNTLLRILIKQVLGLDTFSIYDDPLLTRFSREIGHQSHGLSPNCFYDVASRVEEIHLVKTHEPPPDDAMAIYVVRDGRSAVVSYFHYLTQIERQTISLEDVIRGRVMFGSWSAHLENWRPLQRPATLLLRYEDLKQGNSSSIEKIEALLSVKARHSFHNNFDEMKKYLPSFFRVADDRQNIRELAGKDLDLFWSLHGQQMEQFDYL